jgi:hypothetical protein
MAMALSQAGAMALLVTQALAGDLGDRFDVHGYGFQNYAQTSSNTYLGADKRGTWDNNFVGLVVAATLTDQSKLWMQIEDTTARGANFTWFFVDYQINDATRTHLGRVKLPLGFYNEIIDAKSLHPTALEPAIYQTAADMVHDAYHGVGIDHEQDVGNGHLLWQAWGGNVYDRDPPVDSRDRRAFGGRVTYRTPFDGLSLMLSAYRTQVEALIDNSMTNEDRAIVSAELVRNGWDLKTEYATHKFFGVSSHGYYVQAAYAVSDKVKPYARYDYVTTDKAQRQDESFYQQTFVAGIGYKLAPNIGLKIENHFNRGYALPVASGEVIAGAGSRRWNLLVAAADFAF